MNSLKPPVVQLTQSGLDNAKIEHDRLQKYREEVLVRLQLAREMGDLSENGAYKAARAELGDTDRRLRQLNYLLRFGQVPKKPAAGLVGFGSVVTLVRSGKEITFTIVSEHESNPAEGKLSDSSPIGAALMGKKASDTALVHAPSGDIEYTIKEIK